MRKHITYKETSLLRASGFMSLSKFSLQKKIIQKSRHCSEKVVSDKLESLRNASAEVKTYQSKRWKNITLGTNFILLQLKSKKLSLISPLLVFEEALLCFHWVQLKTSIFVKMFLQWSLLVEKAAAGVKKKVLKKIEFECRDMPISWVHFESRQVARLRVKKVWHFLWHSSTNKKLLIVNLMEDIWPTLAGKVILKFNFWNKNFKI